MEEGTWLILMFCGGGLAILICKFFWRSYLFVDMMLHKMLERWPEQNTSRNGRAYPRKLGGGDFEVQSPEK